MTKRRNFVKGVVVGSGIAAGSTLVSRIAFGDETKMESMSPATLPDGTVQSSTIETIPGKRGLIKRSFRPPNYETPTNYFDSVFTPNDSFFVRWHLANIPEVDAKTWSLKVGGDASEKSFEINFEQLKNDFKPVEVVAVCQCSGNRRGFSSPHVPGVQWGYGAMGNAKWKGVRVRDILEKAGIKNDAVEVSFRGADRAVLGVTPDFIKSIPVKKALDEDTIIAYEMNGEPIPHWNGYPAKLIVPGWTATYWMKQITTLEAISQPLKGFWMEKAYRIPKGKFPVGPNGGFDSQDAPDKIPITEMVVNSLITNVEDGQQVSAGKPFVVKGVAWDAGYGLKSLEVSLDGGKSWKDAKFGDDHGKYSWRQWHFEFTPEAKGGMSIMAKATNMRGDTQVSELIFNPAGYHNNVMQSIAIQVV